MGEGSDTCGPELRSRTKEQTKAQKEQNEQFAEAEAMLKRHKDITISTDEYESMKATLEILSDPKLRDEALKGKEQAKKGKTKKLTDIAKELDF